MIIQLIANGIIAGCTYALVALGFAVIYGTVRFFHFAHGVVVAAAAYFAWALVTHLDCPLPLAAVAAMVAAGLLGVSMELCVYRALRKRRSPNLILLLASFGMFLLVQNGLQLAFGPGIKVLRSGPIIEGHRIVGATVTDTQIGIIIWSALLAGVVILLMRRTQFGKSIRAVADDPLAASLVGINSQRVISYAFFLGSALAGAAGVLVALETNIHPTMGLNAAMKGIIAALIGGMGSIPGALMGGLLIGLAENVGVWGISSEWKDAIAFAILVGFLLLRPGGLFSAELDVRKV